MNIDKLDFLSEQEAYGFVNGCENRYLEDVKKACEISLNGGRIITLCGPSCSGKTTTARILDDDFKKLGKELHSISIDDFYFDRKVLEARSKSSGLPLDYDSPSTIDLELFGNVIEDIERGGKVLLPKFDFTDGRRTHMEEIYVRDEHVFLFEGIQAVYPELVKYLKGHDYTSLFISVEEGISYEETVFSPRELRFMRRLVRDARTRGASAEFTFSLWQSVVANEDKNIYPNLDGVDFKINSTMGYEISVIKPFVLPLLLGISNESEHKKTANDIIKKLENIPVIDSRHVPDESVFREFIGERK
ncbi:MAG: hypothetical protein E7598_01540 [Ruminococcaceae bacterium]|nr:hypothetical protein [Oscillospiraceae bacterium]